MKHEKAINVTYKVITRDVTRYCDPSAQRQICTKFFYRAKIVRARRGGAARTFQRKHVNKFLARGGKKFSHTALPKHQNRVAGDSRSHYHYSADHQIVPIKISKTVTIWKNFRVQQCNYLGVGTVLDFYAIFNSNVVFQMDIFSVGDSGQALAFFI